MTSGTSYSPPPAFGRFKLLHQIGAGVLGPVFRTHDPEHERLVAVKVFTLDLTPEQAAAIAAEFDRLAGLEFDAPCVAGPLAAGVEDFVPYMAVPYASGESLDAAIRQYGPAPTGDAIRLVGHVAEGLDAAARLGVFHGSLHPRDIIVTPGETHVTGIGVAQALEGVGLLGPVRRPYVAPEREGGDEWGAAADIYSLAAIAYEVLTGRRALPGTDQPLPALAEVRAHDAAALKAAFEGALDADPGRRPARAMDFAAAFAAALSESAGASEAGERAGDRRARKPRGKSPKLPGLDEPLLAKESAGRGRQRSVTPPAPAPAAPAGDIRYVPVSDPADAGDAEAAAPRPAPAKVAHAEVEAEAVAAGEDVAIPAVIDAPGAGLAAGPTPDLRDLDALLPRPDSGGETIDAELAAALDRLSSDHIAGPTPSAAGIDLFAPGVAASSAAGGVVEAGAHFDPAAETRLGDRAGAQQDPPSLPANSGTVAEGQDQLEGLSLDLDALDRPAMLSGERIEAAGIGAPVQPDAPDSLSPGQASEPASTGAEPLRPFVRGKAAERRRLSSRLGRTTTTLPTPVVPSGDRDTGVPRAFEAPRATPPARPAPDFELLARPGPSPAVAVPVAIGVAAGLIVGMAAGFWLGSRSAAPSTVPAAGIEASGQPKAVAAPAKNPAVQAAAAAPQPATPAGGASSNQPAAASSTPVAPGGAAATTPAAASPPPSSTAAAVRGAIRVTASRQANVYLDGVNKGMTPRSLNSVPLGPHSVRVTRPGYVPQEQTVVLTPEEPSASLSFALRQGSASSAGTPGAPQAPAAKSVLTVLIESTPRGARIRIDGRDLGPAPLTVRQLRPGTHTVELRLPGYKPWSSRITVAAGDRRQITATLEKDATR